MSLTIIKGTILSAPTLGQLDALPGGYLVAEDGLIRGVYGSLPEQYAGAPVEDWGDALILQSFADLHLHAPQYPMLGMGMDLPLLDWLNAYAFPTEARFADTGYAREIYSRLARELIANGTTRVCMFSSLHTDATLILMEELEKAGVTGYVGKVNMDRNAAPGLLEETTEESRRETLRWLDACQDFRLVKPMLTPRFTPSCTNELMAFLGRSPAALSGGREPAPTGPPGPRSAAGHRSRQAHNLHSAGKVPSPSPLSSRRAHRAPRSPSGCPGCALCPAARSRRRCAGTRCFRRG